MSNIAEQKKYGVVAIVLHWTIALCVLIALVFGRVIATLDMGETKSLITEVHKSLGITIFVLMIVRLVWRLSHRPPPMPPAISVLQRRAAHTVHFLLYAITLVMPVTGYISVAARGRSTVLYGLIDIPRLVPLDRLLSRSAEAYHTYGQYILYALLVAHIGAAIYHHAILKDQILGRMWPAR